jgi:hypothetical protein
MRKLLPILAAIVAAAAVGAGAAPAKVPKGITVAQAEAILSAALGPQGAGATIDCIGANKPVGNTYLRFNCTAKGSYIDAKYRVKVAANGTILIKPVRK